MAEEVSAKDMAFIEAAMTRISERLQAMLDE